MREITKNIELEIEGNKMNFQIRKMDAFNGAYLLKVITEKALPALKDAIDMVANEGESKKEEDNESMIRIFDLLPGLLASMDAAELKRIMMMCLQTVSCWLPAGYQEVVDSRGNFGIEELEYDVSSCLRLVYEVIVFNCSGFFGESGLGSILGNLNGSQPTP